MPTSIPKVIHQTWKTADVPPQLQGFAETFKVHHPGWEYRLWTDEDLRAFVATHYPEFLAIYDGYKQPIKRVDAARYLILRTFGGLYADLDFECFKSIEPLLDGETLVIGLEPHEHTTYPMSLRRGVRHILCPSLIASVPNHPYWDVVYENLTYYHEVTEILDATGPFLLTRCLDEMAAPETVRLIPSRDLYPIGYVALNQGAMFDFEHWDELTRDATAMHHWHGSWVDQQQWWGPSAPVVTMPWLRAQTVVHPELRGAELPENPRVTAVMTGTELEAVKLAVAAFHRQSYANKELVIVTGDAAFAELAAPAVRVVADRALETATGDLVAEWEADAFYHPLRLEAQVHHLRTERAQAAFVSRSLLWWVAERRFAIGEHRAGSMMCTRDRASRSAEEVARTSCYVDLDLPRLCLHEVRGDAPWQRAGRRYEGADAGRVYQHLAHELPLKAYESHLSHTPVQ